MPELPEVQTVLDGFTTALKGRRVTSLTGLYPGTLIIDPDIPNEVFPARITCAERRGKYMLFCLDSGYRMIIHLRMTGKLVYNPTPGEYGKHERARFELEDGTAVHFIDPRTFGKITLCATENMAKFIPELGAEPLSKEFTPEYCRSRFTGKKQPIKTALLDQRIVAGLGNIYVCELLYRCGIDPRRPAKDLSDKELKSVVRHTVEVLNEAIANNGTSISDFRSIDDKTGGFQDFLRVYQKKHCPKGHDIANVRLGGRSSFYCPVCQK